MIILRNKEFSKTEKRDNSLRNAGIAAGIGVTGTGIALEKTRRDIKSKASKKVSDYKRRANNLLGEKINEVDKKAQTDIENVRKETKTKLDKGRRNYKETLQKTRPEIKKAKQKLAESSKKAGEGILSGKNTAEYGVNVKLPSGSRFDYHAKYGYVPDMTTVDRMAEYKQYKNSQITNSIVNRHTKNELPNLKRTHRLNQKNIVESGKRTEKLIQQAASKEKEALKNITKTAIKGRNESVSKAANKLMRKKGGKIAISGLVATGLASAGTYAYTKHRNKKEK